MIKIKFVWDTFPKEEAPEGYSPEFYAKRNAIILKYKRIQRRFIILGGMLYLTGIIFFILHHYGIFG